MFFLLSNRQGFKLVVPLEIKTEDMVSLSSQELRYGFQKGPCLNLWAFQGSYRVVLDGDSLVFEERHGDGRDVRGILLQEDAWLVAPQLQRRIARVSLN